MHSPYNNATVRAYAVPTYVTKFKRHKHLAFSWIVDCPHCGGVHVHEAGEEQKTGHCSPRFWLPRDLPTSQSQPGGYRVDFAGEAPSELLARLLKPRDQ